MSVITVYAFKQWRYELTSFDIHLSSLLCVNSNEPICRPIITPKMNTPFVSRSIKLGSNQFQQFIEVYVKTQSVPPTLFSKIVVAKAIAHFVASRSDKLISLSGAPVACSNTD